MSVYEGTSNIHSTTKLSYYRRYLLPLCEHVCVHSTWLLCSTTWHTCTEVKVKVPVHILQSTRVVDIISPGAETGDFWIHRLLLTFTCTHSQVAHSSVTDSNLKSAHMGRWSVGRWCRWMFFLFSYVPSWYLQCFTYDSCATSLLSNDSFKFGLAKTWSIKTFRTLPST